MAEIILVDDLRIYATYLRNLALIAPQIHQINSLLSVDWNIGCNPVVIWVRYESLFLVQYVHRGFLLMVDFTLGVINFILRQKCVIPNTVTMFDIEDNVFGIEFWRTLNEEATSLRWVMGVEIIENNTGLYLGPDNGRLTSGA